MFVFGLIVGIILGAVLIVAVSVPLACKIYNASVEEMSDAFSLLERAGHNRECELLLVKDDVAIEVVEFLNE